MSSQGPLQHNPYENIRTPALTGSSSSVNDSPLASPFSAHFACASSSPLSKQHPSSGEARVYFEEHPEAWWTPRASVDSSSLANPLDFHPHGLLKLHTPSDKLGAAHHTPDLQFDEYVNSEPRRLPVLDLDQKNKSILSQPFIRGVDLEPPLTSDQGNATGLPVESGRADEVTGPAELALPSSNSYLPRESVLDVNVIPPSPEEMHQTNARRSSFPAFNRAAPHRDPVTEISNSYTCLNNASRPQSSMLAHCGQHSLFPPSETLAQTYSGRLTLREAGVPHGSPRALAPSMPIENVPPKNLRRRTSMFFQRLVHKTFTRPQTTKPQNSASSQFPSPDGPATDPPVPERSRTSRHSRSFSFARTEPSLSKKDDPNPSKKLRWRIVQRFIAKPSAAAKATIPDNSAAAPDQPRPTVRRLSSVSFLGDAMTRVDPFARPGGLGAIVASPTSFDQAGYPSVRRPRRASVATGVSAHTFERYSHIVSFPSRNYSRASRDQTEESATEFQTPTTDRMNFNNSSVEVVDSDLSGSIDSRDPIEPPGVGLKYVEGRSAASRVERRHSAPLLNLRVQQEGLTPRASMSLL